MGVFGLVKNYAKARVAGKLLRRGLGGNIGTALLIGWAGKKMWEMSRARRTRTATY